MVQNGFLGAFFVIVLRPSWGVPSQALKIAQNGCPGAFFVTVLGSSWGPLQEGPENGSPQLGTENGSEWFPGKFFRDRFGFFPVPPPARP